MISRFFIDRPIFATVLSILITLIGFIALRTLPLAQYPRITPPSVQVAISYPGASAKVVANTVAAPIEQQVTGVPGMLYMSSQSGNDGSYTLSVTFQVGVNLNTALVMVQNRVALAMPLLPSQVQNQGITIRKKTPDILMIVNFISPIKLITSDGRLLIGVFRGDDGDALKLLDHAGKPQRIAKRDIKSIDITLMDDTVLTGAFKDNGSADAITLVDAQGKEHHIARQDIKSFGKPLYDDIYLSNYALINVADELLRVDGVSDLRILGERDYSIRAWLDPQKLASRNMTASDVANAIRHQNLEAAAGQIGQPPTGRNQAFQMPIDTLGRLSDPTQFEDIIVKVGSGTSGPPAAGRGGPLPAGSGMPGSGITDPLQMAATMASTMSTTSSTPTTGTTTTSTPTTSTTTGGTTTTGGLTGGAATGGGATASGGGTTAGGGATGGGGTTGGGASGTSASGANASLSISNGVSAATVGSGASNGKAGGAPTPLSTSIVRLKDVGRVEMGAQNYNIACTFDGQPSVGCGVYQLPGTNALDVADRVRAKMEQLKTRFPEGLIYTIGYDTTPYISESIDEVVRTLIDAVILVAIVVLFFLQDWKAMILPMIDVPVSLIGTFGVMAAMGFSLNNISLFGLVLAIGIVVDDAIVVLENIERQMAKGLDVRTATIKAMEEISGPILGITLALCAVFVPCAFISGITGRFFRQFAVTIAASTVISAVNALTMTPSRALLIFKTEEGADGHLHKKEALPWWIFGVLGGFASLWWAPRLLQMVDLGWQIEQRKSSLFTLQSASLFLPGLLAGLAVGWFVIRPVNVVLGAFFRGFNHTFDRMIGVYGWTLGKGMHLSVIVLLIYGGLLALTYGVFRQAPTGFVPQQDMGRLIASIQLPDSSSLERTNEAMAQIDKIVRETPGVAHTITICGLSFVQQANSSNFGSLFIILKPFAERQQPELKDEAIMKRLRKRWAEQVKGAQAVVFGSSPIPGLSVAGGFKLQVEDKAGLGLATLQDQADKLIRKVKDLKVHGQPALASVSTQFRSNTPQLFMDIDRAKVAALGVSLDDVNQTLGIYLGSLYVNSFNEFGRHWQVTVQAEGQFRNRVQDINLLQVRNNLGQMVPLGTLVNVKEITGPIFVLRYNLSTAAPITGGLLPGMSSGDVIAGVDQITDESLPRSMKTEWTELMYLQIIEGNTTLVVFGLAVMAVFLALAALYESWTLPLAVILVVPLCVLCSLLGVLYVNSFVNFLSELGLVGAYAPGARQFVDPSVNIFVQIGLVVLVGLACKNAILVVEFARELHLGGKSVFEATLEASRLRLRPILMTSFAFILGVLPLCFSSGAGAEMRKSLGMAVFSGMLGVTLFGIFLTPVFFYVIQGLGETSLFAGVVTQWVVSCVLGGFLGMASGFLLARLGVVPLFWALIVGGSAGVLGAVAVLGVHRTIRPRITNGR